MSVFDELKPLVDAEYFREIELDGLKLKNMLKVSPTILRNVMKRFRVSDSNDVSLMIEFINNNVGKDIKV